MMTDIRIQKSMKIQAPGDVQLQFRGCSQIFAPHDMRDAEPHIITQCGDVIRWHAAALSHDGEAGFGDRCIHPQAPRGFRRIKRHVFLMTSARTSDPLESFPLATAAGARKKMPFVAQSGHQRVILIHPMMLTPIGLEVGHVARTLIPSDGFFSHYIENMLDILRTCALSV